MLSFGWSEPAFGRRPPRRPRFETTSGMRKFAAHRSQVSVVAWPLAMATGVDRRGPAARRSGPGKRGGRPLPWAPVDDDLWHGDATRQFPQLRAEASDAVARDDGVLDAASV
jgi:hypothetical protein